MVVALKLCSSGCRRVVGLSNMNMCRVPILQIRDERHSMVKAVLKAFLFSLRHRGSILTALWNDVRELELQSSFSPLRFLIV